MVDNYGYGGQEAQRMMEIDGIGDRDQYAIRLKERKGTL